MPRRGAISTARKPSAAERRAAAKRGSKRKRASASPSADEESDGSAAEPTGLTSDESSSDESDAESDAFSPPESDEDDVEVLSVSSDSDALDDAPVWGKGAKAKTKPKANTANGAGSAAKRRKRAPSDNDDDDEVELGEGQVVAGRIFSAPTTGLVPPGQISANTLHFLTQLQYPEYNDREWFRAHEPAFRMAEREYRDFVDVLLYKMNEVDEELPLLPAKDICHRIYRDIRFSADKTPYKPNFGMTVGRAGRRGIWAQYHLYIEPGGHSLLACGLWAPEKPILQRFRDRILAPTPGPGPLRAVISSPAFTKLFGKPKPHPARKRQNVFGHGDELKVAPKGIAKDHPDIDLLKLRSIAVAKHFSDDEVLSPDFADRLKDTVAVMAPLIHTLNEYIAPG